MLHRIQYRSADRRIQTCDRLTQLFLTASRNPGDSQYLSAVCGKRYVIQRFHTVPVQTGQPDHLKPFHFFFHFRTIDLQTDRSADHHFRQLCLIRFCCIDYTDVLAFSQDRHTIGDRHNLVQFMCDDNDRLSVFLHITEHGKKFLCLLRRQNRGRLVQDQNIRSTVEHFQNLHCLLFRHCHIVDFLRRIQIKSVAFCQFFHFSVDLFPVDGQTAVQSQHNILRCRQHIDQSEMLMDHSDSKRKRILRRTDRHRLPMYINFSVIRKINSRQHIHKRCLAASVLSEQCKDLSLPKF